MRLTKKAHSIAKGLVFGIFWSSPPLYFGNISDDWKRLNKKGICNQGNDERKIYRRRACDVIHI